MASLYTGNLDSYPGWDQLTSMAQGKVAPGTIGVLTQQAAERGIATGQPGAPVSNAAYLRALGQTSEGNIMKAQSVIAPLYQQQVSEAGQTSRQQAEINAAMERLKVGNASAMDIARLQASTQTNIAGMNNAAALERARLQAQTEMGIAKDSNAAQMLRLVYSTTTLPESVKAEIAAKASQQDKELALQKYIADQRNAYNYWATQTGLQYSPQVMAANKPGVKSEFDWTSQKSSLVPDKGNTVSIVNPNLAGATPPWQYGMTSNSWTELPGGMDVDTQGNVYDVFSGMRLGNYGDVFGKSQGTFYAGPNTDSGNSFMDMSEQDFNDLFDYYNFVGANPEQPAPPDEEY